MNSNVRAGSSPAPSTKKTPVSAGVFAFLFTCFYHTKENKDTTAPVIAPTFEHRNILIQPGHVRGNIC